MSPGEYLRKRREAAGISAAEVARQLALMHFGNMTSPRAAILAELERAEDSTMPLSLAQAQVLRNVFPLDAAIYEALAQHHFADQASRAELTQPRVCAACACSWNDPCRIHARRGTSVIDWPCSWSPDRPELCTACTLTQAAAVLERAAREASSGSAAIGQTGHAPAHDPITLTATENLITLVPTGRSH